jgi:hypothetical protein
MPLSLTDPEQEVVFLKAINELIHSMVNFEILDLSGVDPDSQIRFKTITHQRFFNIALVDFLSITDKRAPVEKSSYLGALRRIASQPTFSIDDSVATLRSATLAFVSWLEGEVDVDVWLSSIDVQTTLHMPRVKFLKMCGDISKHNFLRSVGVAEDLQNALEKDGKQVTLEFALLELDNFYQRFHYDVLNYHSSTIAEFLNNIRWGIFEYLQPEFHRSFVWLERSRYRFTYPDNIGNEFARHYYWNLMNEVRSPPYVRRFEVTKWLKLRY